MASDWLVGSVMRTVIQGIAAADPLQNVIARKLDAVLRRSRVRATASVVSFSDVNGPKGGVDIQCAVTIEAPRRPAQHASALAADARLALDGALEALERELRRDRGKRRDLARRPKKYFVADLGTRPDGEAALPPVRRRRRSA
jgi:ribosome-associated translation inhibitor RaiA